MTDTERFSRDKTYSVRRRAGVARLAWSDFIKREQFLGKFQMKQGIIFSLFTQWLLSKKKKTKKKQGILIPCKKKKKKMFCLYARQSSLLGSDNL